MLLSRREAVVCSSAVLILLIAGFLSGSAWPMFGFAVGMLLAVYLLAEEEIRGNRKP